MKLTSYSLDSIQVGHHVETERFHVVCGNKNLTHDLAREIFPSPCFLKQIHSDKVIVADIQQDHEADAHITDQRNLTLVIRTADCIPVLIVGKHSIGAIHAGWRGVRSQITVKCVHRMIDIYKESPADLKVYAGPHIQKESFEVGADVAAEIMDSYIQCGGSSQDHLIYKHQDPGKSFLDLDRVLIQQLLSSGVAKEHIDLVNVDTFRHSNYYSYRRNQTTERMLSLVYLK